MKERNFTEVIPGFYRTRDGGVAEVVQILDARLREAYPARGLIGEKTDEWTMGKGFNFDDGCASKDDLITFLGVEKPREKKMVTKTVTRWANIDADGCTRMFHIREIADSEQNCDRIACVEMTGEYEVEEDV